MPWKVLYSQKKEKKGLEHQYFIVKVKCDHYILQINVTFGFHMVSKNLNNMVSNYNHHLVSPKKRKEEF